MNQESRDNIRGSHSCGETLGAEEEAPRLREEFGDSYSVEELTCPKAQDDCWRVGPEQGAELMGWQNLGQDLTSHRLGFQSEAGASLVTLEAKIQT